MTSGTTVSTGMRQITWWPVGEPLAALPAQHRICLEALSVKYPEMRGKLVSAIRSDEVDAPVVEAGMVIESHVHCAATPVEVEWCLVALGFQPDFFMDCVPDAYVSCWTLRLVQSTVSSKHRFADLFQFVQAQLTKAHVLLDRLPGPVYSEVEIYHSRNHRRWDFAQDVSGIADAAKEFPFCEHEFEIDSAITWGNAVSGCGFDVKHKNWDVHVKMANVVRAKGMSWARDSLLRDILDRFLKAGFYKTVSDSGGVFVTLQLRSRHEAVFTSRKIIDWANRFPGVIEAIKVERCPFVWAKEVHAGAKSPPTISPLPPLMRQRQ